jgi:hypothetical protein
MCKSKRLITRFEPLHLQNHIISTPMQIYMRTAQEQEELIPEVNYGFTQILKTYQSGILFPCKNQLQE